MRSGSLGWRALVLLTLYIVNSAHAEYGDVILNNRSEKSGMRPVIFPHWLHRVRFRCSACHYAGGFKMRTGADDLHMSDINGGKYCGMCHNNRMTWGSQRCLFCHSGLPGLQTGIVGGDTTGGPGKY